MKKVISLCAILGSLLIACNNPEPASPTAETADVPVVKDAALKEDSTTTATITLNGGDDMKFDLTEIKVKEGQTIRLTLNHTGKTPKAAMGHNFVLLAHGVDLSAFANEAINAKETDYLPSGKEKDVIAHTRVVGGGESDSIEFTAPAKGTYEFLCTFPGHSAMMKGVFIVE